MTNSKEENNPFLILDSAPCHKKKEVKELCKTANLSLLYIPPRMTNILLPADVCWFKTVRHEYRKRWQRWFINDIKTFTRHGIKISYFFYLYLIKLIKVTSRVP